MAPSRRKLNKTQRRPRRVARPLASNVLTPIVGREYAGAWNTAVAGSVLNYLVHPKLSPTIFPRLSVIADLYSQFKFTKLSFVFRGRSSPTVTANLALCFVPNSAFGGQPSVTTEYEVKSSPSSKTIAAHQSGRFNVPVRTNLWYSVDTDAGASVIGTYPGKVFTYTSATTAAGDAQWDLYVYYSVLFRGPVAGNVIN